jgi:hypothetical protein
MELMFQEIETHNSTSESLQSDRIFYDRFQNAVHIQTRGNERTNTVIF